MSMRSPATRVVFMGYGSVGCSALLGMLEARIEVCAVVPRASDLGGKTSVRNAAESHGIPCIAGDAPNGAEAVSRVRALEPDLIVSVQYDRILKAPMLAAARLGAINLHFSLLPKLRGCFPTKWAILNDEPAGATLHFMDTGIDTGDIIAQRPVEAAPNDTDETLYGKLERAGLELFLSNLDAIRTREFRQRMPQNESAATYHPKALPFEGIIPWERDAKWISKLVRAYTFPPHPAARTWFRGNEIQLRWPAAPGQRAADLSPGQFRIDDSVLEVGCGDGSLVFAELLFEGKVVPPSALFQLGASTSDRFSRP